MRQPTQSSVVNDRAAQARQVLDEYLRRPGRSQSLDHEQLIAAHGELMPELGHELQKLKLIKAAQQEAESRSASSGNEFRAAFAKEPQPNLPPPDSFPGCEIVRKIHRGGQGVVYQAIQTATKRMVAIKVLREGPFAGPHDHARFEREIQILGALNHPHIVTIHDSGVVADHYYFVMDYISGQPLDVYLAGNERSLATMLRLFSSICDAIHAAHLRGIIHRDLKPSNILVDTEGEPHILDFGLAKLAEGEYGGPASAVTTVTGQFVGSLPWASPEQVDRGAGGIDLRTDVYSLGVILYQMLTGRFPYDVTGNVRDAMESIINAEPLRPSTVRSDVNDEIDTVILKCLSKDPVRRYQSAADLARDIDRYLRGDPIQAKSDSTWYVLRKTIRRYRATTAVVLAFFFLTVTFGIGMSFMYHHANQEAETANRVQVCLESLFSQLGSVEGAHKLTVREILDQGAERVTEELAGEPKAQARLMETLAHRYSSLGLHRDAAHWLGRSVAIRRQVLRSPAHILADKLHDLG